MRSLIFQCLINSSKLFFKSEPIAIRTIEQVRLQSTISFTNYATDSKTIIPPSDTESKALDLVNKKHVNPYLLFVKKQYKEIAEKNPTMKSTGIIQTLGSTWKSMSFDEKLVYLDDASKQRQEKKTELANLFKTKEESDAFYSRIKETRSQRKKFLQSIRTKKEAKKLSKPKRPAGAFFLFQQTLDRGDAPVTEFVKGASHKWKAIPTQEKEKYEAEAKELYAKYEQDLKQWETKMLAEGKNKLVRKSFIESVKKNLGKDDTKAAKMRKAKKAKSLKAAKALIAKSNKEKKTKKPSETLAATSQA